MTLAVEELSSVQEDAVRRWKLGHHVFHVFLATMNSRLDEALRQLEAQRWDEARVVLLDLARLYHAATATMRYAADFPKAEYERLIRPSMMPPFASEGFSGVHNVEHILMLDGVATLRRGYKKLGDAAPEPVREAWQRLIDAQRRNRRNHMHVCRHFVDGGESLLKQHFSEQQESEGGPQR